MLSQIIGAEAHNVQLSRSDYELLVAQQSSSGTSEVGAYAPGLWHRVVIRFERSAVAGNSLRVLLRVDDGEAAERMLPLAGTSSLDLQLGSYAQGQGTKPATHFYDDVSYWNCGDPDAGSSVPDSSTGKVDAASD